MQCCLRDTALMLAPASISTNPVVDLVTAQLLSANARSFAAASAPTYSTSSGESLLTFLVAGNWMRSGSRISMFQRSV